ncbi:DUF4148 domain-containing protein [Castellaniella sp.]|uniref:DUF4148 domain-containing protein n=1 Tax=Castellaniella sp. TaxID=1955812 RepID=UPI002AFE8CC8|nr:DUF4148 domain-containing protein [Castellaniella sp.]
MKTVTAASIAVLSLGLVSAGMAQADQSNYPDVVTPSTQTRAEVVHELRVAQSEGQVTEGEQTNYPQLQTGGPALSRAQVLAQLRQAEINGQVIVDNTAVHPS